MVKLQKNTHFIYRVNATITSPHHRNSHLSHSECSDHLWEPKWLWRGWFAPGGHWRGRTKDSPRTDTPSPGSDSSSVSSSSSTSKNYPVLYLQGNVIVRSYLRWWLFLRMRNMVLQSNTMLRQSTNWLDKCLMLAFLIALPVVLM